VQVIASLLILASPLVVAAYLGADGERGRKAFWALFAFVLALVTYWVLGQREPGVQGAPFAEGVVATVGITAALLLGYRALGTCLRSRRGVLLAVVLASFVPLALGLFFALLWIASLVTCPPGSYECPI
jgi:hypothetical protein